jgi:capsular polysaccharide biosynthesis protein/Mrp family chromosome partitioning ATPase
VNEERVESGRYLRALREHWPYILGTVVLALAAALLFVETAQKRYDAGTDVLVTPVPSQNFVGIPLFRETDLSRSVVTAARIVTSPQVVDGVKERLNLDVGRGELRSHVSVTPQEQSSILTITGKAATPEEAARIANAFANVLIAQRTQELQREVRAAVARLSRQVDRLRARGAATEATALADQLSTLRTLIGARDPTLQVVSRAVAPEAAAWPRPVLSLAVASLAGLLLGLGIAIGIELVNPLVLRETDVVDPGGPPVLARVPHTALNRIQSHLLPRSTNAPPSSTIPYRGLWANLGARTEARRPPDTVLFTSADQREGGAASVAIGLAVAVALTGRRVVLVDADTRVAAIGTVLEASRPRRGGLRAVLVDDAPLDEVLVPTAQLGDRLRVLTTRPRDETLLGLVPQEQIEALVDELGRIADVVVFAAPPLLDAPDALALVEAVDAVVVTIELGHTRRARVSELRRDLGQRGIVPAGFVVVGRRRGLRDRTRFARPPDADAAHLRSTPVEREPTPR